jgi:hypothetical protein
MTTTTACPVRPSILRRRRELLPRPMSNNMTLGIY